jgi:hypothetical protein
MSLYRVAMHSYRGHQHGQVFEANLTEPEEARALARGAITLQERSTPALVEGSYQLPRRMPQERGADAHPDPDQGRGRNSA